MSLDTVKHAAETPEADLHALRDGKRLRRGRLQMDQQAGGEGLMETRR